MHKPLKKKHFCACGTLPKNNFRWNWKFHFCPFLDSLTPLTSINEVQITWKFQRNYFWMSFVQYLRITIIVYFLQLYHFSKERGFFEFFSIFKSNLPLEDNVIAKIWGNFLVNFKNLIGFGWTLWEMTQTSTLWGYQNCNF